MLMKWNKKRKMYLCVFPVLLYSLRVFSWFCVFDNSIGPSCRKEMIFSWCRTLVWLLTLTRTLRLSNSYLSTLGSFLLVCFLVDFVGIGRAKTIEDRRRRRMNWSVAAETLLAGAQHWGTVENISMQSKLEQKHEGVRVSIYRYKIHSLEALWTMSQCYDDFPLYTLVLFYVNYYVVA